MNTAHYYSKQSQIGNGKGAKNAQGYTYTNMFFHQIPFLDETAICFNDIYPEIFEHSMLYNTSVLIF